MLGILENGSDILDDFDIFSHNNDHRPQDDKSDDNDAILGIEDSGVGSGIKILLRSK